MEIRSEQVILNLSKLMSDAGLNQRQLALKSNIDPTYLNRVMKGHTGLGMEIAQKLARGLGCSIDDIFLTKKEVPSSSIKDAVSILSAYEKLLHDNPKKAGQVREFLGLAKPDLSGPDPSDLETPIGRAHKKASVPRQGDK